MGQIRAGKYAKICIFNVMLRWAIYIYMNQFRVRSFQQWYTKIGKFIPYRLGHMENIFWILVNGLFIFWTCSSLAMLPTTRCVLSSTRLVLGRAPALQLRPMVLCQAAITGIHECSPSGPDLTHSLDVGRHVQAGICKAERLCLFSR